MVDRVRVAKISNAVAMETQEGRCRALSSIIYHLRKWWKKSDMKVEVLEPMWLEQMVKRSQFTLSSVKGEKRKM